MKPIDINGMENVNVLDEFGDIYDTSKAVEICETDARPSEIFARIKDNKTVVLKGDYGKAEAILWYIHHYEDKLAAEDDLDYYRPFGLLMNCAAVKRFKVHRLNYLFCKNEMPLFSGGGKNEILDWLPEDVGEHCYLLPARRYMRILTDIKRADEGIFFDFIGANIHIAPFVYVPFDKSVPEMFLYFKNHMENKKVLDMGTGTGILALLAAKLNAKSVTAADINPKAAECAKKNIARCGFGAVAEVVCSDLFGKIQGEFDTIIFNAPWIKGEPKNIYEAAIYDPGYRVITDFFVQSKSHLAEDGAILLQYSDISQADGNKSMDNLHRLLAENNFKIAESKSILRRNRLIGAMERVFVFLIKNG